MPEIIFREDGAVLVHNKHCASFIMHNVHSADACAGEPCVIHNPSHHRMSDFDLILRESTLMERACPHGVGHPDPDSLHYFMKVHPNWRMDSHGCDGCCLSDEDWSKMWTSLPDDSTGPIVVGLESHDGITGS